MKDGRVKSHKKWGEFTAYEKETPPGKKHKRHLCPKVKAVVDAYYDSGGYRCSVCGDIHLTLEDIVGGPLPVRVVSGEEGDNDENRE